MASELLVDVTYRGLAVGRGLRLSQVGPRSAYLACEAPMPVGTELVLAAVDGVRIPVRVLRVQESAAELPPGMRIGVLVLEDHAKAWWYERITDAEPLASESAQEPEEPEEPPVAHTPEPAEALPAQQEAAVADAAPTPEPAQVTQPQAEAPAPASQTDSMVPGVADTGSSAASLESLPAEALAEPERAAVADAADVGDDSEASGAAVAHRGRATEVMSAVDIEAILQAAAAETAGGGAAQHEASGQALQEPAPEAGADTGAEAGSDAEAEGEDADAEAEGEPDADDAQSAAAGSQHAGGGRTTVMSAVDIEEVLRSGGDEPSPPAKGKRRNRRRSKARR